MRILDLPQKFTVKRSEWLRWGESLLPDGSLGSCLYRSSDGKKCCLGFLALEAGCTLNDIRDVGSPENLFCRSKIKITGLTTLSPHPFMHAIRREEYHTEVCKSILHTNDTSSIESDEQREEELMKLFQELGVEVIFVD